MSEVYRNTLDGGAWVLLVTAGDASYRGELTVSDRDGTVVHQQGVAVSYGAPFGPDLADVENWKSIAVDVIDHPEKREI